MNSLGSARAGTPLPEPRLADVHLLYKNQQQRDSLTGTVCILCRGWCVCVFLSPLEFAFAPYPIEIDLPPEASTKTVLTQVHGDPLSATSGSHQMVLGVAGFFPASAVF